MKIGGKVVAYGRTLAFQLAVPAGPRDLFGKILRPICDQAFRELGAYLGKFGIEEEALWRKLTRIL